MKLEKGESVSVVRKSVEKRTSGAVPVMPLPMPSAIEDASSLPVL